MKKQFSKKEIEKRFYNMYPDGELFKQGSDWYWTDDTDKRLKRLWGINNYYDLAEKLYLASPSEIAEMKKLAGYVSYQ